MSSCSVPADGQKNLFFSIWNACKIENPFLLNSWEITQCPIFYDTAPRFPCQGKSRGKKQAARRCLRGGPVRCHGSIMGQFWGGGVWPPAPWPPPRRWPRRCQRERLFFSPPSPGLAEGASRLGFSCRAPLGLPRPRLRLLRRREGRRPPPAPGPPLPGRPSCGGSVCPWRGWSRLCGGGGSGGAAASPSPFPPRPLRRALPVRRSCPGPPGGGGRGRCGRDGRRPPGAPP